MTNEVSAYRVETNVVVYNGDALNVLKTLPDNSVDAVVTDPPYGLSKEPDAAEVLRNWLDGEDYTHTGNGFMGKTWDSFVPGPALWREVLRVLKPGGYALVFAGTRTQDLMGMSLRLAGFEIRDSLAWLYGNGFPKSLNVDKAIRKSASNGSQATTGSAASKKKNYVGLGTTLKPAHEPILVARKPLEGTVAENVLAYGTGALNIDGCRVEGGPRPLVIPGSEPSTGILGDGLNGSKNGGTTTRGRWPANVVLTHSPGCRATGETREVKTGTAVMHRKGGNHFGSKAKKPTKPDLTYGNPDTGAEPVPVYQCEPGCPIALMDKQSGTSKDGTVVRRNGGTIGPPGNKEQGTPDLGYGGEGGASRFFANTEWEPFLYQAKAPQRERPVVDGVAHPTVKPLALMQWLTRLACPQGGTVLDPFSGSGTTLEAALNEGFHAIGVEITASYLPLIDFRIDRWTARVQKAQDDAAAQLPLD